MPSIRAVSPLHRLALRCDLRERPPFEVLEGDVERSRLGVLPDVVHDDILPPYTSPDPGDPRQGAEVYATYCSACHGPDGRGGNKASSIVDGAYLALVSDQNLRTVVIIGRPELGAPDWRNDVPGKPMSPQEISNVVAWLAAQRPRFPAEPVPNGPVGSATRVIP